MSTSERIEIAGYIVLAAMGSVLIGCNACHNRPIKES